jgi:ribonucleoside-diphosphate reductase alpha chain
MEFLNLSNPELKSVLNQSFENVEFKDYLRNLLSNLSIGLKVDLNLLDSDLSDELILKTSKFGAIDSLKRSLQSIAESANYKATSHPDWSLLAGRIEVVRLKLLVPETLKEMLEKTGPTMWRSDHEFNYYNFVLTHWKQLENIMCPERDYDLYFFGVRTLEKSYLLKYNQEYMETPQMLYLRIATFLWMPDLQMIKTNYDLMSTGAYTHASPTMFHAGIRKGALASCYLLSMQDDLEKIFKCLGQCAMISKAAGGIGLDITNIRHTNVGNMGESSGIVPMLKVYDATMRYVDQCFDPDTIVYTKTGPKRIGEVSAGEKLVSMNGKFSTVAKPMHYTYSPDKDMYSVQIKNYFRPIIAAGVHPMLVLKDQYKGLNFSSIKNKLEKNIIHPEFVPISELNENCIIAMPIPQYVKDLSVYDIEDCYMYGILIGDGHKCSNRNEYGVSLGINNKKHLIDFVKNYLKIKNIHYWENEKANTLSIRWTGGAMFPFNGEMIYHNHNKIIHHSMLHLPKEKCMAIIKGLIETDGCYKNTKEISFYNSSLNVIEGLRYMLLRFGIGISGFVLKKRPGEVTKKDNYCLRIPKVKEITDLLNLPTGQYTNFFVWNNMFFTRVTKVEKIQYTKNTIVELEMEDQTEQGANYLTAIGLAHNGGRRKGSATIFLQPWHIDFPDFIELKRQHGKEERRARDLFYSVWTCDIFMDRVKEDKEWTLFCPKYVPELCNTYGTEFEKWYLHYEEKLFSPTSENYCRKVSARKLWNELLTTQIETGMPFITHKDAANYTSNQQNLGLIRSSNLCQEIMEVTDENTISSCNLASIALDEYIENGVYNFNKLGNVVSLIINGLNRVIDRTYYPLQESDDQQGPIKKTNMRYRPLGIGVQALADAFLKMGYAWNDPEAKQLNRDIFATIYYYAVNESVELAKLHGVYDGFDNSPASKGMLKPDLFAYERARKKLRGRQYTQEELDNLAKKYLDADLSPLYDWDKLREKVKTYGLRNSLLVALMPTASSAQIRYKNESFEPFTTNMYVRSVLAGHHYIFNRYMINDLEKMGLWNKSIINFIIKNEGSIQNLPNALISAELQPQLERVKQKCLTAFELPQKLLVDLSIDRAYYVCQSQSLNIHYKNPTIKQLTSLHFYAWENALATGMYYLRTAPSTEAIQFTVDGDVKVDKEKTVICTEDVCISCQS